MLREEKRLDSHGFIDLKGHNIDNFYIKKAKISENDTGAKRIINVLDEIGKLKYQTLVGISPTMAFHFAILVDSLLQGNYSNDWRRVIIREFVAFIEKVSEAKKAYDKEEMTSPILDKFASRLRGSASVTANFIRHRHYFFLNEIYERIAIKKSEENSTTIYFGPLEKEIIWNRDGRRCQNPNCSCQGEEGNGGRVAFSETEVFCVNETPAENTNPLHRGVLLCPDCYAKKNEMKGLIPQFREYLNKKYSLEATADIDDDEEGEPDDDVMEEKITRHGTGGKLEITINWGLLDVNKPAQIIAESTDSKSVARLISLLIKEFDDPMLEQLKRNPIIRFPLSTNPEKDFWNFSAGKAYGCQEIPEISPRWYVCTHSSQKDKIKYLRRLFQRLVLPDGQEFPDDAIIVSGDELSSDF
jgi:hypothetical protein